MKIGFLGCGQMGGALARAVRRADPAAVMPQVLKACRKVERDVEIAF